MNPEEAKPRQGRQSSCAATRHDCNAACSRVVNEYSLQSCIASAWSPTSSSVAQVLPHAFFFKIFYSLFGDSVFELATKNRREEEF